MELLVNITCLTLKSKNWHLSLKQSLWERMCRIIKSLYWSEVKKAKWWSMNQIRINSRPSATKPLIRALWINSHRLVIWSLVLARIRKYLSGTLKINNASQSSNALRNRTPSSVLRIRPFFSQRKKATFINTIYLNLK